MLKTLVEKDGENKIRRAVSSERWKINCQRESIINARKEKYRNKD